MNGANAGFSGHIKDKMVYINVVSEKGVLQNIADAINATPAEKEQIQAL